jgi:hypothetical protein
LEPSIKHRLTCMFSKLRNSLVIFLALLQLVAPLVHAHACENNQTYRESSPGKLHIPGLEAYSASNLLAFDAVDHRYATEGIAFGVDAGIKQKEAKHSFASNTIYFLAQQPAITASFNSSLAINSPPPVPIFYHRLLPHSQSPRAPPAQ